MKKGLCICLLAVLALMMTAACGDAPHDVSAPTAAPTTTTTLPQGEPLDALSFTGRVLEVQEDGSAALMEPQGECPLGNRVWVQLGGVSDVNPQAGELYKVTYEDMVMLSLPPRINAVTMVKVDEK